MGNIHPLFGSREFVHLITKNTVGLFADPLDDEPSRRLQAGYVGIPQWMGWIPGMTYLATAIMKSKMKKLGVPTVREYLEMMVDGGAKLYACKMSVDMFGLKKEDFVDGVQSIVTAGDFMDMSEGAQIIFI